LEREINIVKRDRDEIKAMQIEETQKIIYDSQFYKDRLEEVKTELNLLRKDQKDNIRYKELYEELKSRED
jgi:hypothetical protein